MLLMMTTRTCLLLKRNLLWHQRLSHTNLPKVRLLCKKHQWVRVSPAAADSFNIDAILPTKFEGTSRIANKTVKCASCCLGKQSRRPVSTTKRPSSTDPEMKLKTNHLSPGDCISVDHYVSPVRGRRRSGFGRNSSTTGYVGGSLYVDHASGKLFHFPQTELTASATVRAKQCLEAAAADVNGRVKAYHSDNGVFASQEFKDHCSSQQQRITFSGVGAHHQNGVAERGIGTVSRMARSNLLHLMLHWPLRCKVDLWALSMDYAVWIYNRVPLDYLGGLSPNEFWSGIRSDHADLKHAHVFGCPVYVLDPKLQDGKSIPKWNSRSRQGMFVGYSAEHSSMVPLVLNIETGHISPQFHVIFDDHFHTVSLPLVLPTVMLRLP
jgi:transposase InsO family protein